MSDALILRLAHVLRLYVDWTAASPNLGAAADVIVEVASIMEEQGQGMPFDAIDGSWHPDTIPDLLGAAIREAEDTGRLDAGKLKAIIGKLRDHYRDYPDWHEWRSLPGQSPRSEYHGLRDAVEARYFERQKVGAA